MVLTIIYTPNHISGYTPVGHALVLAADIPFNDTTDFRSCSRLLICKMQLESRHLDRGAIRPMNIRNYSVTL